MSTSLSRKYIVQVTSDLTLAGGFIQFNGIDDWNDTVTPTTEETTAYDTNGWKSNEITLNDWSATLSAFRRNIAGTYDPGQELVRACRGQTGTAGRCGVRWFDRNGGPEAYQGVAIPTWTRSNTGVSNVEKLGVTFMADGALQFINNPGVAAAAPLLLTATPSGAAAGEPVEIQGTGFATVTGATGVKFGGTNAAKYIVVSDNVIVATLPAGSAGSAVVLVTNTVGASNSLPYTRG